LSKRHVILVQVGLKMLRTHRWPRPRNAALEQRKCRLPGIPCECLLRRCRSCARFRRYYTAKQGRASLQLRGKRGRNTSKRLIVKSVSDAWTGGVHASVLAIDSGANSPFVSAKDLPLMCAEPEICCGVGASERSHCGGLIQAGGSR